MKKYKVRFSKEVVKQLKKLDKSTTTMIKKWIAKNLEYTTNPRLHGKALSGNHKGEWRYRVENYRLLAYIFDDEIIILIFKIDHRSSVYK